MSNNGRNLLLMQLNQLSTKMGETHSIQHLTSNIWPTLKDI